MLASIKAASSCRCIFNSLIARLPSPSACSVRWFSLVSFSSALVTFSKQVSTLAEAPQISATAPVWLFMAQ